MWDGVPADVVGGVRMALGPRAADLAHLHYSRGAAKVRSGGGRARPSPSRCRP